MKLLKTLFFNIIIIIIDYKRDVKMPRDAPNSLSDSLLTPPTLGLVLRWAGYKLLLTHICRWVRFQRPARYVARTGLQADALQVQTRRVKEGGDTGYSSSAALLKRRIE